LDSEIYQIKAIELRNNDVSGWILTKLSKDIAHDFKFLLSAVEICFLSHNLNILGIFGL
jgi:hypothetical protein